MNSQRNDPRKHHYQRYKSDTNTVATWIANTAKLCGYPFDANGAPKASEPPPQQPKGRLKGKARKQAKGIGVSEPQPVAPSQADTEIGRAYKLKIKEFVDLAKFIASYSPSVSIPIAFFRVLDRTIDFRTKHGEQIQESKPDDLADESHTFFIDVLRKVRDILLPRTEPKEPRQPAVKDSSSDQENINAVLDSLSNKFSGLQVEEPSEDIGATDSTKQPPAVQPPANPNVVPYSVDLGHSHMEEFFAVCLFIEELQEIREFLKDQWAVYADEENENDFTPAVLTNVAIYEVRRLELELYDDFPALSCYSEIGTRCFSLQCSSRPGEEKTRKITVDILTKHYDLASSSMFGVYAIMKSVFFHEQMDEEKLDIHSDDEFGAYNPTRKRSDLSNAEKLDEDKHIVTKALIDYLTWAKIGNEPAEDELFRAVRIMLKTRDRYMLYPTWVIFAAQAFVDMHHELREKAAKPFLYLQKHAERAKSIIQKGLRYHEEGVKIWDENHQKRTKAILRCLHRMTDEDELYESAMGYMKQRRSLKVTMEKFRLLKFSPLRCGMLILWIRTITQQFFSDLTNNCGSIMYSMHLYNTMLNENLIAKWDDMDVLLRMFGPQMFFMGDAPKTRPDVFQRFQLASGTSATQFAANKRQKKKNQRDTMNQREIKKFRRLDLEKLTPFTDALADEYEHGEGRMEFSPYYVKKLIFSAIPKQYLLNSLNASASEEDGDENEEFSDSSDDSDVEYELGQSSDNETKEETSTIDAKKKIDIPEHKLPRWPRWMMERDMSTTGVLGLVGIALDYEATMLELDFFPLHKVCFEVFRMINRNYRPLLALIFPELGWKQYDERGNAFLLQNIFKIAVDEEIQLIKEKEDIEPVSWLGKISADLDDVLKKEGTDVLVSQMNEEVLALLQGEVPTTGENTPEVKPQLVEDFIEDPPERIVEL